MNRKDGRGSMRRLRATSTWAARTDGHQLAAVPRQRHCASRFVRQQVLHQGRPAQGGVKGLGEDWMELKGGGKCEQGTRQVIGGARRPAEPQRKRTNLKGTMK